jgi:hypothetical protein
MSERESLFAFRSRGFGGNVYLLKSDLLKYLEDGARDFDVADREDVGDALRHIVRQLSRVS